MEPSLNLAYNALTGEVGHYLGFGRGAQNGDIAWNAVQQRTVDSIVASGMRQFYYPPSIQGISINWSFLKPTGTLNLDVNSNTFHLPDDFGGLEGQITILGPNNTTWWPIEVCNEGQIRASYSAFPSMTGRPLKAAIRPQRGTGGTQSQRFDLFYFPVTDTAYTVQTSYYINPDYLSGAFPYAYGGPPHTETLLESCLAIAEQRLDDQMTVHSQKWMERLTASAIFDNKMKAQVLGYNRDNSDNNPYPWWRNHFCDQILFNGVFYEGPPA